MLFGSVRVRAGPGASSTLSVSTSTRAVGSVARPSASPSTPSATAAAVLSHEKGPENSFRDPEKRTTLLYAATRESLAADAILAEYGSRVPRHLDNSQDGVVASDHYLELGGGKDKSAASRGATSSSSSRATSSTTSTFASALLGGRSPVSNGLGGAGAGEADEPESMIVQRRLPWRVKKHFKLAAQGLQDELSTSSSAGGGLNRPESKDPLSVDFNAYQPHFVVRRIFQFLERESLNVGAELQAPGRNSSSDPTWLGAGTGAAALGASLVDPLASIAPRANDGRSALVGASSTAAGAALAHSPASAPARRTTKKTEAACRQWNELLRQTWRFRKFLQPQDWAHVLKAVVEFVYEVDERKLMRDAVVHLHPAASVSSSDGTPGITEEVAKDQDREQDDRWLLAAEQSAAHSSLYKGWMREDDAASTACAPTFSLVSAEDIANAPLATAADADIHCGGGSVSTSSSSRISSAGGRKSNKKVVQGSRFTWYDLESSNRTAVPGVVDDGGGAAVDSFSEAGGPPTASDVGEDEAHQQDDMKQHDHDLAKNAHQAASTTPSRGGRRSSLKRMLKRADDQEVVEKVAADARCSESDPKMIMKARDEIEAPPPQKMQKQEVAAVAVQDQAPPQPDLQLVRRYRDALATWDVPAQVHEGLLRTGARTLKQRREQRKMQRLAAAKSSLDVPLAQSIVTKALEALSGDNISFDYQDAAGNLLRGGDRNKNWCDSVASGDRFCGGGGAASITSVRTAAHLLTTVDVLEKCSCFFLRHPSYLELLTKIQHVQAAVLQLLGEKLNLSEEADAVCFAYKN